MIETFIGVFLGALTSWIITHFYYKKQEHSSPAPMLHDLSLKIQELIDLSPDNKPVQTKLKELKSLMLETHLKVFYFLLPYHFYLSGLKDAYESGDTQKFNNYLKEVLPKLFKFNETFKETRDELFKISLDDKI
jgi:hypothetical protein